MTKVASGGRSGPEPMMETEGGITVRITTATGLSGRLPRLDGLRVAGLLSLYICGIIGMRLSEGFRNGISRAFGIEMARR